MPSREPELYKDKVEVSLDGRQIFYLFFGGAVIVGCVFVLGVLVGRRVEARGHIDRARTHATTDPLAALDRLEGNGGLSFRGALTGKDAPTDVEKSIADMEKKRGEDKPGKAEKAEAKAEAKTEKTDAKPEAKPEAKPDKVEKADKVVVDDAPVTKPDSDTKKKSEPKLDKADRADKAESKPEKADKADKPEKTEKTEKTDKADKEAKAEPKPDEAKARFTLQLSSFQDRSEAEAFLQAVKAQGYQAQITQAEVEGKGTFYRVRMGSYRSLEAANTAKAEFEKSSHKNASIMKL